MGKIKINLSFYQPEYTEDLSYFGFDCDYRDLSDEDKEEIYGMIVQRIKDDNAFVVDFEEQGD